jgi:hypothetical protein
MSSFSASSVLVSFSFGFGGGWATLGEAASVEEVSGYSIKLVKMLSGWREVGLPCHRHRYGRWSDYALS